jgi:hypothetical protein
MILYKYVSRIRDKAKNEVLIQKFLHVSTNKEELNMFLLYLVLNKKKQFKTIDDFEILEIKATTKYNFRDFP